MMPITKTLSRQMCIAVVLLFLLSPLHAQQYGWKVIAKPGPLHLYAVEFVDSLHGWCAGSNKIIYHTNDGGFTWRGSSELSEASFVYDISFFDDLNGWATGSFAGDVGQIWRTTDGGISWTKQFERSNREYRSVSAQNILLGTVAGSKRFSPDTGKVVQTKNGGALWTERTIADSIAGFGKVVFVDSLHGWLTAGLRNESPVLLRTHDGGKRWEIIPVIQGLPVITFLDTLRGWGAYNGYIYRTRDGGIHWEYLTRVIDPMWDNLHETALSFVDSLNGWAFGYMFYQGDLAGVIFRTTDGGNSWYREHVGLTRKINDGLMLDKYHGWAAGDGGVIIAYQLITSVPEKLMKLPKGFVLHPNYPNPFTVMTNIEYELMRDSFVSITIYDATGREVRQLVNSRQQPGVYRILFDTSPLASGIYSCTMKAGAFSDTKQMTFLK